MLISKEEFNEKYGEIYRNEIEIITKYKDNPDILRKKIEKNKNNFNQNNVNNPYPDPYPYQMTYIKGFTENPLRLKNYIIAKNQPKDTERSFYPFIMDIEPNCRCNFRCVTCQVSDWNNGRRNAEDMSYETFVNFMQNYPYFVEVKLHGMGEPLLNKDFFKMTEYMAERYIWVRTSTNGSLLHIKDGYKRLIDSGIGEVQCSFDGASKEVFEKIRRGSNFDRIFMNFKNLNEYANKKNRLYTRMWVVIQKENRKQMLKFIELAKQMGFRRLSFAMCLNDWGQEKWKRKNMELQSGWEFENNEWQSVVEKSKIHGVELTIWKQGASYSTNSPNNVCPWPFERPYISAEMKIVPCCMISNPNVINFGDARDLVRLWNGSAYSKFRQNHLNGEIPQYCCYCYRETNC